MDPTPSPDRFEFGDFVLERSQHRVRHRNGTVLDLAPRQFAALLLFVERAGDLLDKDLLMRTLWPGLVVEENNLNQIVRALRVALGDAAPVRRYIQTVPTRGFRFVHSVASARTPRDAPPQVSAAPAEPPPAPAAASSGNLPLQLSALYGREADLAAVVSLLGTHAVVSIVGAGGIGKTKLGLAAAAAGRRPFDAVWWVELSGVEDAALLPTAVASAIGLKLPAGRPALDALAGAISDQRLLLVLDNCEQVAADVAALVDAVRRRAGGVRFLITSQVPVKADGERVYRPDTLALPVTSTLHAAAAAGAVALFVDRAAAAEPRFGLKAENVDAVIEVCRRLDGIPLALELAAARVPLLGIDALKDRLDRSFELLTGGARTRPRRQQTLRAALEWSCGLLSEDEQVVLRRLGVFMGGFTLPLAQWVVTDERIDEWAALDLLGTLVDRSLVVNEGGAEPRYRLLETTRSYALEQLDRAGELPRWRRRHAQALLRLLVAADAARWEAQPGLDSRIHSELDNARAALAWSTGDADRPLAIALLAASMPLWLAAGLKAEGAARCAALAPMVDESVPKAVAARFWLTQAMMGLFSSSLVCYEAAGRAAGLFGEIGDARGAFEALIVRTGVAARRSEPAAASAALAQAERLVDPQWAARRRSALPFAAWVNALNARRHEEAVEHAWREVALCRDAGSPLDEAIALGHVGIAETNVPGQEVAGEARLREAIAGQAAAGKMQAAGHAGYSLCLVLLRRGALDEALEQARKAYKLLRSDGEQALMLGLLPLLAVRLGRLDVAANAAGYAAAVYARAGLPSRGLYGEAVARLQECLPAERYAHLAAEGAGLDEEAVYARVLGATPSNEHAG